jgi:hypothetical protein
VSEDSTFLENEHMIHKWVYVQGYRLVNKSFNATNFRSASLLHSQNPVSLRIFNLIQPKPVCFRSPQSRGLPVWHLGNALPSLDT